MIEFAHHPDWRWLASGAVVAALLVFWSYRTALGRPRGLVTWWLMGLRGLILAGVLLCLLDPRRVEVIRRQERTRLAVLLDDSRSMELLDEPGGRFAAARDWLRQYVIPAVPAGVELDCFALDQQLSPAPALIALSPTGGVTAIGACLGQLLNASGPEPRLVAAVLCSDGRENAGGEPEAIARAFRRRGIPIHTLAVGTTNAARDIIVENVRVGRAVSSGAATHIGVTLRSIGFTGLTVPVQVTMAGTLLAAQEVVLGRGAQQVELEITPHGKGFQLLEVRVPPQPGEWLTNNNQRRFGLNVQDSTLRVIYMEGSPTQAPKAEWEYLVEGLESDPSIKVSPMFRPQNRGAQNVMTVDVDPATGNKAYHVQHPTHGFPRTMAELLDYDVVINSDIYREAFTQEQLRNTVRLVEEFGGGFVMIGGITAFGSGGYHRTVIDKLIPAAIENETDIIFKNTRIAIPPGAWGHPLLALGSSPEETRAIWTTKFPMLYGYNQVDRLKPGAVALVVDAEARNRYGPRIIIAAQEVGKGRSMAYTSDTTREWGRDFETIWGEKTRPELPLSEENCDSRYYKRFWINAIRWLAAARLGHTNRAVSLEIAQTVCHPGDAVAAAVRVLGSDQREVPNATVTLSLLAREAANQLVNTVFERDTPSGLLSAEKEGASQVINALYDPASRTYKAQVQPDRAGDYFVVASARGAASGEDRLLLSCEDTDRELEDPRANPQLMASLARASGGQAFTLRDPANPSLASLLSGAAPAALEYKRTPLWDRGWLLASLLGLLTLEWVVRRLKGLS